MERALIIRQPWIGKILSGEKIWEMRSTSTKVRGVIGLIEQGTGLIVGEAEIATVFGPLTRQHCEAGFKKHCVPAEQYDKWKFAWVLFDAKRYDEPIPYDHPKGAVIWVKI